MQQMAFEATRGHVLELSLVFEDTTWVLARLYEARGAAWEPVWSDRYEVAGFNLPDELAAPLDDSRFALPPRLRHRLTESLGSQGTSHPFWIQLVEPFGYLGLVPWGLLLEGVALGPVLRLPTISLERRTPTESLQVALLAPVPYVNRSGRRRQQVHSARVTASNSLPIPPRAGLPTAGLGAGLKISRTRQRNLEPLQARHLDALVTAILAGSPRPHTTVHVVTTPWITHDLRALWRGHERESVILHDPAKLARRLGKQGTDGPAENFWFRLLEKAQEGQQADVVHLVAHGSVVQTRSRLVLADALPGADWDTSSRYMSISGLQAALDGLGAWSVCVTSPPSNDRVPQLRYLATRLIEKRPGPLLFTDFDRDPECLDVEAGYRFLFAQKPGAPPRVPHTMLSCEPHRVAGFANDAWGLTTLVATPPSEAPANEVLRVIHDADTPAWVAGAQRFIERQQIELTKLEMNMHQVHGTSENTYRLDGIRDALEIIQQAVAQSVINDSRLP